MWPVENVVVDPRSKGLVFDSHLLVVCKSTWWTFHSVLSCLVNIDEYLEEQKMSRWLELPNYGYILSSLTNIPPKLTSSQYLVMFESITLQDQSVIFLRLSPRKWNCLPLCAYSFATFAFTFTFSSPRSIVRSSENVLIDVMFLVAVVKGLVLVSILELNGFKQD